MTKKQLTTLAAKLRRVRGGGFQTPWRESANQEAWLRLARFVDRLLKRNQSRARRFKP